MSNEHNPIAQLISRIQQKWLDEITPNRSCKLIRLLIDPDETKLYQGFLQIESSTHGKIPDLFTVFLTPFHSKETYSHNIIQTWIETYEKDQKTFELFQTENPGFCWDAEYFGKKNESVLTNADGLLLEMISSFHSALQMPDRKLTLVLMPHTIGDIKEYEFWLKNILTRGIPDHIQFCIVDYAEQRYFEKLFSAEDIFAKTFFVKLDLQGAVNKIIQSGDPNSPEVQLRKCMVKMSEAVDARDVAALDHWGQTCIDLMRKSKVKSLMATAYIIYAGMLFNFKKHAEIESLLFTGLKAAEAGKLSGDVGCQTLEVQFLGYIAANYQLSKKNKEAVEWFCKQAKLCVACALPIAAVDAYWHAGHLAKKSDPLQYRLILKLGYEAGENSEKAELECSQYCNIALDYYLLLKSNSPQAAMEVDNRMVAGFGNDWKENTQQKTKSLQVKFPKSQTAYASR